MLCKAISVSSGSVYKMNTDAVSGKQKINIFTYSVFAKELKLLNYSYRLQCINRIIKLLMFVYFSMALRIDIHWRYMNWVAHKRILWRSE